MFGLASNVAGAPGVYPSIKKIELLEDGPMQAGIRWKETRIEMGREATLTLTMDRFDPPHAFAVSAEAMGARYVTTLSFSPDGEGTLAVMETVVEPLNFGGRIMAMMSLGAMKKSLAGDLEHLAQAAEKAP